MDTKINMNYRFVEDNEPTDEQLLIIMQEVAEEARRGHKKVAKEVIENIRREYVRIRSEQQIQ